MPLFRRQRVPRWDAATADEELVAWAQRGEREAFGALYDRYLHRVYGYCYRLLGTREAAEDANTEVFMRALAALPVYRVGSFRSWLFAIAHNVVADELRRRRPAVSLEAVRPDRPGPVAGGDRHGRRRATPRCWRCCRNSRQTNATSSRCACRA